MRQLDCAAPVNRQEMQNTALVPFFAVKLRDKSPSHLQQQQEQQQPKPPRDARAAHQGQDHFLAPNGTSRETEEDMSRLDPDGASLG